MGAGLGNLITGVMTGRRGKKIAEMGMDEWKKKRGFEEYKTPESYTQALDLMKKETRKQMPGYTEMKQGIEEAGAVSRSAASNLTGADAAAVLLGEQQNKLSALRQLGLAAAQYRQGAQQNYIAGVGQGAQYENQAYEYNQWLPWQMKLNEQQGYQNAAM